MIFWPDRLSKLWNLIWGWVIFVWKGTFGTLGTKYWLFGTVCGVQSYFTVYLRKHAHCSVSSWAWRKSSFTLHAFLLIKGRIVFIPTVISAVGVYLERDRESRSIWNSQISLSLRHGNCCSGSTTVEHSVLHPEKFFISFLNDN